MGLALHSYTAIGARLGPKPATSYRKQPTLAPKIGPTLAPNNGPLGPSTSVDNGLAH